MPAADASPRRVALALGTARAGLGIGALFAPKPTLKALQFGETDPVGIALGRLAGGRDLALGLATLAMRNDTNSLRALTAVAGFLDAADATAMGINARDPDTRLAALGGVVSGASAALLSAWAWRQLGP